VIFKNVIQRFGRLSNHNLAFKILHLKKNTHTFLPAIYAFTNHNFFLYVKRNLEQFIFSYLVYNRTFFP
jgi:hypothetical protein